MTRQLYRSSDEQIIAEKAEFARSFFARIRGMIGRKFCTSPFDAMVFERCNAIHCCWMSEAIDVLFVTADMEVVKVCSKVAPWRFASGGAKSKTVIELPAGTIERCRIIPGDRLVWK